MTRYQQNAPPPPSAYPGDNGEVNTHPDSMMPVRMLALILTKFSCRSVASWTRHEQNLFCENGLLLIPVNVQRSHWCLVVIDLKAGELVILDSLGPARFHASIVANIRRWLHAELQHREIDQWQQCAWKDLTLTLTRTKYKAQSY